MFCSLWKTFLGLRKKNWAELSTLAETLTIWPLDNLSKRWEIIWLERLQISVVSMETRWGPDWGWTQRDTPGGLRRREVTCGKPKRSPHWHALKGMREKSSKIFTELYFEPNETRGLSEIHDTTLLFAALDAEKVEFEKFRLQRSHLLHRCSE